jgi:hypothetical protein
MHSWGPSRSGTEPPPHPAPAFNPPDPSPLLGHLPLDPVHAELAVALTPAEPVVGVP